VIRDDDAHAVLKGLNMIFGHDIFRFNGIHQNILTTLRASDECVYDGI